VSEYSLIRTEYMIKAEVEIMIMRVTGESGHFWMLTAGDVVNTRN
jgi:hypothetical protein